eukprot:TRINITY_DN92059_c0_g1_i1.p1 TRINITY_DN92059_c0_g1~~TRINITY_DN92059_c0_g1_i1.p1  ORF type:complete len:770 (-),score=168.76 TRINITY_DN92059_c0_g1_i1:41-2350(-)
MDSAKAAIANGAGNPAAVGGSSSSSKPLPVLRGAAEAIAASLNASAGHGGSAATMEATRQLIQLREVLLAENAAASDDAALRSASLRAGIAAALRTALTAQPQGSVFLTGSTPSPKTRVEVRQTAARYMLSEAFTIGRAAECDVQTTGDVTASKLQMLAIALPGGIVLADAWSGNGTRMVRRSGPNHGVLPASVPQRRTAIFVPHGERVTLLTGAKTTVTIGPAVKDLPKEEAVSRMPTPRLLEQAAQSSPAPAPKAQPATPKAAETTPPVAATVNTEAKEAAQAVPAKATEASKDASAAAPYSKTINAMRTNLRVQQHAALRERLRGRCQDAKRMGLLTESQCEGLQRQLGVEQSLEDVRDVLDGLGVPPAPDDVGLPGTATWTCSSCSSTQRARGWRCPFRHRCCRQCMLRLVNQDTAPACPHASCGYFLGEADLQALRVPEDRIRAIVTAQGKASPVLSAPVASAGKTWCPNARCGAAVALKEGEARRRWSCFCGAAPMCTACSATPYHYHGECKDVQTLRSRWLAWLQGGREAYKGLQKRAKRTATTQHRALKEACEFESQQSPAQSQEELPAAPSTAKKPTAAQAAKLTRAKCIALGGTGVRHLLAQCSLCSGDRTILGPRFRCIHCPNFNACLKCEAKAAAEHHEGHVFEIMFEDDLDWERIDVQLPKGVRARLRRRISDGTGSTGQDAAAAGEDSGRKRMRAGLCCEGVLRGQKRGKYALDLLDGTGVLDVAPCDLQPLLTQKQAERLLSAGVPGLQEKAAA